MSNTDMDSTANPTQVATPLRIGQATLLAQDLEAMATFYQNAIGLQRLRGSPDSITFGAPAATGATDAGVTPLLILRRDLSARPRQPAEAGLFHTAFLLPQRADIGAWLAHAASSGVRLTGAADHLVSEAVYLNDPEGNGIEIYVDRARDQWTWRDGQVVMRNERLDVEALVRSGGAWSGVPAGTTIGHIHLQVGELVATEAFYKAIAGFDVTCQFPAALFLGSGGYHHHIAANIWNSQGAIPPDRPVTGLCAFEILVNDQVVLDTIAMNASRAGVACDRVPDAVRLTDPWGIEVLARYNPAT